MRSKLLLAAALLAASTAPVLAQATDATKSDRTIAVNVGSSSYQRMARP